MSWYPRYSKYRVCIGYYDESIFLGYFDDPFEAGYVYD
jgi:hypothetical protein